MSALVAATRILFWLSTVLLVHHHLIYPAIIRRAARWRSPSTTSPLSTDGCGQATATQTAAPPSMTLIVPAHNEEKYIAAKIQNLCAIDYPADRLNIVVVLDGCTDDTRARAIAAASINAGSSDLEIAEYEDNIGKLAVLNAQIERATTEIIALSDASALVASDALARATFHFAAPDVGFVAATYRLLETSSPGEKAYNEYLTHVRHDESILDSPLGVHGSLYFFRRDLWRPMAADTINDDFVLPMRIVERGYRGVYDPNIVSHELERTGAKQEARRRVRLGAGNMQQTLRLWRLADPRRPWMAFMFISGKGGRPFVPFIAILGLCAVLILAATGSSLYAWLAAAILAGTAAGAAAVRWPRPWHPTVLAWLGYLLEGHLASLFGGLKYLLGHRITYWQKTPSTASAHQFNIVWTSRAGKQGAVAHGNETAN